MEYTTINHNNPHFKVICDKCEQSIVLENLKRNGGTLNYSNLTYDSDYLILCMNDEEPIGFCSLVISDDIGLYVYQIAVKKEYQKKGIGTALLVRTKDIATALGINISAHVMAYNKGSQVTFENSGFIKSDMYSNSEEFFYQYKTLINSIDEEKGLK